MAREIFDFLEIRFAAPGEDGSIEGTGVAFDQIDSYNTTFDRRAFEGMAGQRLPMLWSHRSDQVIGHWSGVTIDADGLQAKGQLNLDIQRAKEVRSMLMAGDISGLSVGFQTLKSKVLPSGVRAITKARLYEISLVAMPSVPGSRVTSIRSGKPGALSEFITAVNSATRAISPKESK